MSGEDGSGIEGSDDQAAQDSSVAKSQPEPQPADGRLSQLTTPDDWPISALQAAVIATVPALVLLLTPLLVTVPSWTLVFFDVAVVITLYAMLVTGLNLQFGHTGLVNFGHVAFFAVGGYTAAMLTADNPFAGIGLGLPWPVGIAGGMVVAAALGGVLGVTTLRLRDDFLAIVTLAIAEIIHDLLGSFQDLTGGGVGLNRVAQPIADLASNTSEERVVTLLLFGALALVIYAAVKRLTDAPYGRVLRAIRADDQVAETLGKNVFRYKLVAFIYGAAIAGFAGAIWVFDFGAAAPGLFTINVTVLVWVGMLIGGPGNDRGVIAGVAIILTFRLLTRFMNEQVPAITSDQFASLRLVMVGALLIVIIRYKPEGIWGNADELGVDR